MNSRNQDDPETAEAIAETAREHEKTLEARNTLASFLKITSAAERAKNLELISAPECSLELLVNTATKMPDLAISEAHAAHQALRLITACSTLLEDTKKADEERRQFNADAKACGVLDHREVDGFKKIKLSNAAKFITGQNRPDRAEQDFQSFLRICLSTTSACEDGVARVMDRYKTHGMSIYEISIHRAEYERLTTAGVVKKPGPKKNLPSVENDVSASSRSVAAKSNRKVAKRIKKAAR